MAEVGSVQKKLFTRWCNFYLAKRNYALTDLATGFQDGILLAALVGEVTGKEPPRLKAAKLRVQCIQNVGITLQFIAGLGVKMVNIEAEDFVDGKEKIILAIIWNLIQRYQLHHSDTKGKGTNAKDRVLYWARKTLQGTPIQVKDLSDSWQDGVAFCTVVHQLNPSLLSMDDIKGDDKAKNLELAFSLAETHLGIPRLLDVEDVVHKPDEQGIITYLSFFAKDLASIEPPPNFIASLSAAAPAPAAAKQKPSAKIFAKTAPKLAPLQTEKIGLSVSTAPPSPHSPSSKNELKPAPKKVEPGKPKEAASVAKPPVGDGIEVLNNVINLKAAVDKLGNVTFCPIETVTRNDRWSIRLQLADSSFTSRDLVQPTKIIVKRDGDRIEETLEKMETGIEHAFLVKSGPPTPFSLKLVIKTDGITKTTVHDSNLCFWGGDSPVFAYQNLIVHDATGKQLQSKMFWDTKGPYIVLDILEVPKYPVTVDPLATIPGKGAPEAFSIPTDIHLLLGPTAQIVDASCSASESESDESSSSSNDSESSPKKRRKPKIAFGKPQISFGGSKKNKNRDSSDSDDARKVKWPAFSLGHLSPSGKTFGLSLRKKGKVFGKGGSFEFNLKPVAAGATGLLKPPALPELALHLHRDGTIEIFPTRQPNWNIKLAPVGLSANVSDVELLQGNNIILLRGGGDAAVEWEQGLAFDKKGCRLFFIFHKPTNSLSFKFKASDSLKVKRLSDAAISFNDSSDAPRFGFGLPSVRVGSTSSPQRLEWNNLPSGDINIQIPHAGTGVVALSFVLSSKGQAELFSRKGESDESTGSSEEEKLKVPKFEAGAKGSVEVEKSGSFKFGRPSFGSKGPEDKPKFGIGFGKQGSSLSIDKEKTTGKEVKVKTEKPGLKVGLPSFSLRFPKFKLRGLWTEMLYGSPELPPVEVAQGQVSLHTHPFLNLAVGLSLDGSVSFTAPDWKLSAVPTFSLSAPKLLRAEGLHLLRADDGEIGLSFDKTSSRHFFFIGKSMGAKFSLQLKVDATSTVIFNKDKRFIVILDRSAKPRLVYSSPVLRLASNKTVTVPLEWDAKSSCINVPLPDQGYPIVVAFGLGPRMPESGFGLSFPSFKFGAQGEVDLSESSSDSEDEKAKAKLPKVSLPSLTLKFPSFKLSSSWKKSLYGNAADGHIEIPSHLPATHVHPSLGGVSASLAFDQHAIFESSSQGWKVDVHAPSFSLTPKKLVKGTGLQLLTGDDGEVGLSFDNTSTRHFYMVGKSLAVPKFSIQFKSDGCTFVFDKVKSAVVVLDKAGRIQLVYTAPVVRHSSNKTSTPDLEWDPASSLLSVVLPDTSFPLVIAFGVGAKLPEVKGGFSFSFPSLKLKGEGESSDSESDDDEDGKKAVGFGFNVKVPRFGKGNEKEKDIAKSKGAKASTSAPKIKFGLPEFAAKFPHFKLGTSWAKSMYGYSADTPRAEIPKGQLSIHAHPALNGLSVGLAFDGAVSFEAPDWKLHVAPLQFGLSNPKLYHGDGLHLLRGDDGEVGVSFDKSSSRHFFFFGKAPALPKFSLELKLDGTSHVEFNPDKGALAILDKSKKVRIVYAAPVVLLPGGKTITPNLEWDGSLHHLSFSLPELSFPLVIAFGVGVKVPEVRGGFHLSFPSFKFGAKGEIEDSSSSSSDSDEEGDAKKKRGQGFGIKAPKLGFGSGASASGDVDVSRKRPKLSFPSLALKFPHFDLSGPFAKLLYGDPRAPHVEVPHGQPSLHLHPFLNNIQLGLSFDGSLSFECPDWKASVSPLNLSFASPKLSRADGSQILSSEDAEVGVSFDKHSSRHFFFLGGLHASPKFTLNWKFGASIHAEFNKEKGVLALLDGAGKPRLVYSAPILRLPQGKTIVSSCEWDPTSSSLSVALPEQTYPLVIVFGLSVTIPEIKGGFHLSFPSFKFGAKGAVEEPASSSDSDEDKDEDEGKKKRGLDIKVPKFGFGKKDKSGDVEMQKPELEGDVHAKKAGKLKLGLPDFSLKFPHFKLGTSWTKSLYGDLNVPHVEVPQGQLSIHPHPSLGDLKVGLSLDGTTSYDSPGWKFEVVPSHFSVSSPKLFTADGLHLLRGVDGEIGISFDKYSSRHFFFLGKAPALPKFSLGFKLTGSSRVEFHKDKGVVAIHDPSGKLRLVYSAPVLRLPSGKTHMPELEWDASSSSIYVSLPELSVPLVIAFGVSAKLPDVKGGLHLSFPSFKFGSKGEVAESDSDSDSDDEEKKKKGGFGLSIKAPKFGFGKKDKSVDAGAEKPKVDTSMSIPHAEGSGKIKAEAPAVNVPKPQASADISGAGKHKFGLPSFMLKFPKFKLGSSWSRSLYGDADVSPIEVPHGQLSIHRHPSLNDISVGLAVDGTAHFDAPDWKFAVSPLHFSLSAPKLLNAAGIHLLRGDDGEIGISFDKQSSRHFFFFGKAPSIPRFSLAFKLDGSRVEFHKDKGVIGIHDAAGKLRLVYSAPVLRLPSGKTHMLDLEWDASSSSISVSLPDLSFPLVIAFGLGVKIPDSKGGFGLSFPSFKFGAKGEVEESDSSSDSDEEDNKKKGGFSLGVKAPKFGFGKDKSGDLGVEKPKLDTSAKLPHAESSGKIKLGFPSFALKFPKFKLGSAWTKTLYGDLNLPHVELPHGQLSIHLHPALNNLNVGLSLDGVASYEAPDWALSVRSLHFSLTAPNLTKGDGLHLLRGEDGEIGISFDKQSSRHFFFLGKAPASPKFSLELKLDASSHVEYNKDKGALGIFDKAGKLRLVYSAPVILLSSGKTATPDLEWDQSSSSISFTLPDLSLPLVIAFGVGVKFPDTKGGFHLSFPSFKFGAKGDTEGSDSESDSDDEEKKKGGFGFGIKVPKVGKKDKSVDKPKLDASSSAQLPHVEGSGKLKVGLPSFTLKFPNFKLGSSWTKSLYGDLNLPHIEIPHGQLSLHLHPSLNNLNVGLSHDGIASYNAPDWSLLVSPLHFSLTAPKLTKGDGLHLARGEDGEVGISFDKQSSRHFFFLGKAPSQPKFSLGLKLDGSSKIEYKEEKGALGIFDKFGKLRLVYSAPIILLPSGKTVTPDLEWNQSSSSISIALPDLSFPLVIAFGVGVKFPDAKGGFHLSFPSFKFGAKGEVEASDSDSDSDDVEKKKKGGFGFGIKAPKFGHSEKGEVKAPKPSASVDAPGKHKHGFPSFTLQFPKFKLGSSWSASLYGDLDAPHIEVPHGQLSTHIHPHLGNLNVGLSLDGTASYDAPDWKLVIAPTSFSVSAPKLYTGAGLHLLRGDDGEIGISFDKNSSRHFFFIGKVFPLSAPKFSLSLKLDSSSKVEHHKEKGVLAVHDKSGKLRLVYSAPVVKLASGKTITPALDWDSASSSISIALPDLSFPLVIAFGVGIKIPDTKGGFHLAFPSFKFGAKGEIEDSGSSSDEEEQGKGKTGLGIKVPTFGFGKKDKVGDKVGPSVEVPDRSAKIKIGMPSFSLKFPTFKLGKSWTASLYGDLDAPRVELPSGQLALHAHPALNNLTVGLSFDGAATFEAPDWRFAISPLHLSLTAPKLFSGDGLHLLRGDDGEIGISFDKKSSRHFFFIGKSLASPKFSLKLKLDGSSRVELNKDKGVVTILDKAGKIRLVYTAPIVLLPTGKTTTPNLELDSTDPLSPFISISLPDVSFPLVIAFGLGVKLPDKGGFHMAFPSFKFGAKGEIEHSDSDSDDDTSGDKKKGGFGFGIKAPKFGFGGSGSADKPKVDASADISANYTTPTFEQEEADTEGKVKVAQAGVAVSAGAAIGVAAPAVRESEVNINIDTDRPEKKSKFKLGLPSLSLKFPKFKLGAKWHKTLYGDVDVPRVEVPHELSSTHFHPSLHLNVSLSHHGVAHFEGPDFKISAAPQHLSLSLPKLFKSDGLQVAQGDDGEIGLSFDKNSSRHFFVIGKAPSVPKFALGFQLDGSAKLNLNAKGVLEVLDSFGKIRLVYSAPVVRLPANKSVTLPLSLDVATSTLSISLPDLSFPLVIAFGLGLPDGHGGFNFSFPSFKFGSKGEVEDSSSSDDDEQSKKKRGFGFGMPKFGGKADIDVGKPGIKVGLPSFTAKFPKFKLDSKWLKSLYGHPDLHILEVPHDNLAVHAHPSLNLNVGLSLEGVASYDSPDWKLSVVPLHFTLSAPKLYHGDGLHVVRGDDGEIGISFDKSSSRHFFFLGKAPSSPKFTLNLRVDAGSQVQFNKEKGFIAIHDKNGKVKLAYTAPLVRLPSNKSITLALEWDSASSSLSVALPDLSFPIVLAFGLSIPDSKGGFNIAFPSFKLGGKGEIDDDSSSDEEESKKGKKKLGLSFDASPKIGAKHDKPAPSRKLKIGLPSFSLKFPSFKLDSKWKRSLYGDTDPIELPHVQASIHPHASLGGLNVGLSINGEVTFDAPNWKFFVSPFNFALTSPKLLHGDGLHLLRGEDGEIGVSFDKSSSRHFFFLGKAPASPTFSLELKVHGSSRVELNSEKGVAAIYDQSGKLRLVYLAPVIFLPSNKTITAALEFDPKTSSLSIPLPDLSFPLVIAFGLSVKIPDVRGGFHLSFPSFRFGEKGEVSYSSDSDSDDEEASGKRGLGLKMPKFGTGKGDKSASTKFDLPSFALKFPKFKLDAKWRTAMYGKLETPHVELPTGQLPKPHLHGSLNGLHVGLSTDGIAEYDSPDWKLAVSPIHFSLAPPKQLLQGADVQLLRAEDGEIGISFDKDSSRHFFFIGKALSFPKFSLGFKTDASARIDFNKEKGFLAIYDKTGKLRIVYASPILRLPSNKTASAPLDWDASSSSIHVALPEAALSFPLVLVFGLSVKLPEHGHDWFRFSFPSIKLPKPGFEISDSESDDDNDESKQKSKGGFGFGIKAPKFGGSTEVDTSATLKLDLPQFALKFPKFKLGSKWTKSLYGGVGIPLVELPHGSPSVHLHPSLNLKVSLSLSGVHYEGPDWNLLIPHPPALSLTAPKLLHGEGLQLLRDVDGEIGMSFDKHSSRHFFFFGKAPSALKFTLKLQIDGSVHVELNKEKGLLLIVDKNNKVHFAYAAPLALLSSNKTVTLPLDWDAASSSVVVTLPDLSFPLVIAFSISIPDAKGGFSFGFPSFKLGAKGEVEEESSGSDEEIKAKGKDKGKGKGGFEVGAKVPKIKIGLPAFSLKFPKFHLPSSWKKSLYGNLDSQIEVPQGQLSLHIHPHLNNLNVGLSIDGIVSFNAPDWKLRVTPAQFHFLSSPKLYNANGLHLLRGDDGEVGVSFDKHASRHFFFVGAALPSPKFSLHFQIDESSRVEFDKEKGFIAIYDKSGKLRLVYSSPIVHLSSNATTSMSIEWDAASSSLTLALPDLSFPFVVAFGVSAKLPDTKGGFHLAFPSFKFGTKGEIEALDSESDDEEDDDDDDKAKGKAGLKIPKFGFGKKPEASADVSGSAKVKIGLPHFALKFPTFKLSSGWTKSLYGDLNTPAVKLPHLQPSIHAHPSLNGIKVGLSWDSVASFEGPTWKLSAVPSMSISSPQLHQGEGLHLLRGDDGEVGISFDKHSTRHFFVLTNLPSPRFSIKFKLESGIKVEYNTDKGYVAFVDITGKPHLVYTSPVVRLASGKTTSLAIDWDGATSSIFVDLPDPSPPLVLAFGLGLSLPDAKGGFGFSFPSFKFKGNGAVSDSDESDDQASKGRKFKFGFGSSGQIKFPSFRLGSAWHASLYGASAPTALPAGQISSHTHPSLDLSVGLSGDGTAKFGGIDGWELSVSMPLFTPSTAPPQLFHGDGLHLLRGEEGEIGLSYDPTSSRHFCIVGKPLPGPKFKVSFKLDPSTKVECNKEKGYIAFVDKHGKLRLVYSQPILRLPTNKTDFAQFEWDAPTSSIFVSVPDTAVPTVIAFGVGTKIPDGKLGFSISFPSLKLKASGEVDDDSSGYSSDDEEGKKKGKFGFPKGGLKFGKPDFSFPSFSKSKFPKFVFKLIYGDLDLATLTPVPMDSPSLQSRTSLNCSSEFSHSGKLSLNRGGPWGIEVVPTFAVDPASFELVSGDKLSLLRSADNGEIGITFDRNQPAAKHFFMIPKHTPKFSLKFTVSGNAHAKFSAERQALVIGDSAGAPHLIYNAPGVAVAGSKKLIPAQLTWNAESSELSVDVDLLSFPLALIFPVGLTLPPPDIKSPALGFSLKGIKGEESDSESSSESDDDKKGKKKFGFSLKRKDKDDKAKVSFGLPKLVDHWPSFGKHWRASVFGKSNEAALALEGESSALRTPHGLGLTIFPNGSIELAAEKPTWNLLVVPTTFEAPTRYELFRSDSFVLFKSANWDEGISFDDSWVRYFFVLHKKPGNLNLRFKLKATGLSLIDLNAPEAMLTFNTPTGEFGLVICKPIIRTAKAKRIKPQFDYNKSDMEFTIAIPEDATFPLSVTLGASVKMPSPKVIELLVGSGEEDEHEAETSEKKKIQFGLKLPTISFPSFSFGKSWKTAIYGPQGDKSISAVEGPDFHLDFHPTLKARVGISANGLEILHPEWKLVANPIAALSAKLPSDKHEIIKGEDFFSFKTPNFEFGFGFHGAPKIFLSLHKPVPGNTLDIQLHLEKLQPELVKGRGHFAFKAPNGSVGLAFSLPVIRTSNKKTIAPDFDWKAPHSLSIALPTDNASYPLVLLIGTALSVPSGDGKWNFGFKIGLEQGDSSSSDDDDKKGKAKVDANVRFEVVKEPKGKEKEGDDKPAKSKKELEKEAKLKLKEDKANLKIKLKQDKEAEKDRKREEKNSLSMSGGASKERSGSTLAVSGGASIKGSGSLAMSGGAQGGESAKKGKISGFMTNLFSKGKHSDSPSSPGRSDYSSAVEPDYEPTHFGFHLPSFGKSLSLSLFGKSPKLRPVKRGDGTSFTLPSVHVSINSDASAEFRHANWSLNVSLLVPELVLGPETDVFTGSGQLITLKSGDFEEGLSVVKGSLKQFFILPARKTFTLRFQAQGIGRTEFDKSQGKLTLSDTNGQVAIIYHKPYLTDANKKSNADVIWNPANNSLVVTLPEDVVPPLALIFAISFAGVSSPVGEFGFELGDDDSSDSDSDDSDRNKDDDNKKKGKSPKMGFGSIRKVRGGKGKDKPKDDKGAGDIKGKKSSMKESDASWKVGKRVQPIIGKAWTMSLYAGTTNKSFPVKLATNGSVAFDHTGLNLRFALNRDGAVEVTPLTAAPWRIRLNGTPENLQSKGDLFHSEHFLNARIGDFEQTLSTEKDYTRHFFLLPRSAVPANSNTFSISVQNEGGPVEFDTEQKRLIFKDGSGKIILVYCRPLIRDSNKQIIPAEFKLMDGKEIVVAFPANATFPLALVFGLTSKVLSDDGSLGLKLDIDAMESDESDSSEDDTDKTVKKKLKFPEVPSPTLKIGDKRSKNKSWLGGDNKDQKAAFKKNGRRRSFGKRLFKNMFADKSGGVNVEGETTNLPSAEGHQTVFRKDGSAQFGSPDWRLEAVPVTLTASPSLRSSGIKKLQFTRGDSYAHSKQDLWEGGLSQAGNCSKHYFRLAAAPEDGKFFLKLNSQGLHGTYDAESGYVIFLSKKDMPQVVYVPALLKQANDTATSAPLIWSEADNTISISVPESLTYPVSLVFATFNKIPTAAEVSAEFGLESQGSDSSESGEDKKAGRLKLNRPHFTFDHKLRALYGKIDHSRLEKDFKITAKSASLVSPGTDLQFLLATDGVFTVSPAKSSAAQEWSVRVRPSFSGWGDAVQMYKGGSFVSARLPNVEQGASTSLDTTKHFFLLSKGGSYSLRFEGVGIGKVHRDKSGKIFFADIHGHPLFVYSKPSFRIEGKRVAPKTTWDENSHELHIEVPQNLSCPIGVVCAVCTCTLPPSDVIYSVDDGFAVLHPRVNFIGRASRDGISYSSMRADAEPWSVTLSIEGSQVENIYAKSKCTVALNRSNNITEFLSYVDRGEYLGLHHSFHITAPPATAQASGSLRIPFIITQRGITQITQQYADDSHGAVTFHTAQGPVLSYERMAVCDAHGRALPAQTHHVDGLLVIEIVVGAGVYPLVVS